MIVQRKRKTQRPTKNEAIRAQILLLKAQIEREEREHDARVIPRYWLMGRQLRELEGSRQEKIALVGKTPFERARRIKRYFATLADAKAYPGSLRMLLDALKKPGRQGRAAPTVEKKARALIKEFQGDVSEVIFYLIDRHWKLLPAVERLQRALANQKNVPPNTETQSGGSIP